MADYLDNKSEKIQKGFYKLHNDLFYFTGNYDIEGFPIFEIEGDRKRYSLYVPLVQELSKVNNEEINKNLKKLKKEKVACEKIKWLEEKLRA